jgi:hypothetical protein
MFRKLILLLIGGIISLSSYGDNRLLNDSTLLIDSYTNADKKEVLYYFMSSTFPGLKDSATILIDGNILYDLQSFKMCNGGSGDNYYPWNITTAKFKPANSTPVKIIANGDYGFCVHGLKNLIIDGSKAGSGYTTGTYSAHDIKFGFNVTNLKARGQVYSLSVLPGGTIDMQSIEGKHGFCIIKVNGYVDTYINFYLSNFYLHDSVDGEGIYMGSTQANPVSKIRGCIQNGVIARTACEGLQLQHVAGFIVKDVTIFATATAYLNPFQQYQDTGIQWVCAEGSNLIDNIVVDGYRSVGINLFGGDGTGAVNVISNTLMFGGHGSHINIHNSCNTGATWTTNVAADVSDLSYYTNSKITTKPFIISQLTGDKMTGNIMVINLDKPRYVNSGFVNSDIVQWKEFYAGWLQSGIKTVRVNYKEGQIVIDTNNGYNFYRCLVTHDSETVSPRYSAKFAKLQWDGNDFPPDDLRLINYFGNGIPYENKIIREYYKGNKRIVVKEFE